MRRQLMDRRKLLACAVVAGVAAAPAAATAAKPGKSSVTIAAKPATVTFGKAATISGRATGKGAAGASVTLQHDAFPFGSFSSLGSVFANQLGDYTFTNIKPLVNN